MTTAQKEQEQEPSARVDRINWKARTTLRKFADEEAFKRDEPFEVLEHEGNLLLNEGIGELLDLLCGIGGGEVAYSNANARIGVGDGDAPAADPDQVGLQGGNTAFKAMDVAYPQRTDQTMYWRSTFGVAEANFAWKEWTIDNGAARNKNLNRKVEDLGTKVSGTIWQFAVGVTVS